MPLVGSTSTAILAAGATEHAAGRPVLSVVDGRRRELFVERWQPGGGGAPGPLAGWQPGGIGVVSRADLGATLGRLDGWLAIGDGAVLERDALTSLGASVPDAAAVLHELIRRCAGGAHGGGRTAERRRGASGVRARAGCHPHRAALARPRVTARAKAPRPLSHNVRWR